jgi:hypothetical protein
VGRFSLLLGIFWAFSLVNPSTGAGQTATHPPNCTVPFNNDCPAFPPPTCNVILNEDYKFVMVQPTLATNVNPAIDLQYHRHFSSYPTYELPLTFLSDALGIGNLMQKPKPALDCCHANLVFTRDVKRPPVASFEWSGGTETVVNQPNPLLQGQTLTLTIPANMSGVTVVTGGATEFLFSTSRPHLKITNSDGSKVFDSDLQCVKASVLEIVVRPPDPSGTQTNPVLWIHP